MQMQSPIAASISSAAALAEELDRHRVLSRERLAEAIADFPGGGALSLAEFLIARSTPCRPLNCSADWLLRSPRATPGKSYTVC